jgi:hypothetical protein
MIHGHGHSDLIPENRSSRHWAPLASGPQAWHGGLTPSRGSSLCVKILPDRGRLGDKKEQGG